MEALIETAAYYRDFEMLLSPANQHQLSALGLLRLARLGSLACQWDDDRRNAAALRKKTAVIVFCHAMGDKSVDQIAARVATTPCLLVLWGEPVHPNRVRRFQAHHEPIIVLALARVFETVWNRFIAPRAAGNQPPLHPAQVRACIHAVAGRRVHRSFF